MKIHGCAKSCHEIKAPDAQMSATQKFEDVVSGWEMADANLWFQTPSHAPVVPQLPCYYTTERPKDNRSEAKDIPAADPEPE